jgi:hypothetical protein
MHYRGPGYQFWDEVLSAFPLLFRDPAVYYPNEDEIMRGALPAREIDFAIRPAPDVEPGVSVVLADRMQPGLTAYTPFFQWEPVRLIDAYGNTYHTWRVSTEIRSAPRLDDAEFPDYVNPTITDFHVYPDGRLLVAMSHDLGYQPFGYGLAMLDTKSNVLWTYMKQTHHRLDVGPDGRIAVLLNAEISEPWRGLEKIEVPFLDDVVAILSPDGEEQKLISVLDSFQNSYWESVLQFVDPDAWDGDILHVNAAKFLSKEQVANFPFAREGDLLLSLRNIGVIAVLNPDTGKIVWAMRGAWHMQHDPDVLPSGNIILFDNRGDLARQGRSRIIEFNPKNGEIVWQWPGRAAALVESEWRDNYMLYTSVAGSVERLTNGNTLIAESTVGRIIEVDRKGAIVWEYFVPERVETLEGDLASWVWHPQRYSREYLSFIEETDGVTIAD